MKNKQKIARKITLALAILLTVLTTTAYIPKVQTLPQGIPRGDIVVIRSESKSAMPDDMNILKPGNVNLAVGGAPIWEPLWFLDVVKMRLVPMLAAAPPQYENNFTIMIVKIREGVYWSDGVEFTADDVVFTIRLFLDNDGLTDSGFFQTWVDDIYAEDKYTVVFKLKKPNPRFHNTFVCVLGLTGTIIVPKHIWEGKDPLKFTFNPPVGTGPYVLKDYDPQGYWALFERRSDWQRSATGIVFGKPKPKYIYLVYYAPDDPKQVVAISRHEMDFTELTMELWNSAKEANPYLRAFWPSFPYAWQHGICDHGPSFNLAKYPFNLTDVRWALTLAINMTDVNIMALDGMGRIAAFRSLSVPYLETHYKDIMLPWLENFTLPGDPTYKPWDPTVSLKLAEYAKSKGYELPEGFKPQDIWGLGWWKYDPQEAAKLLEKHGFYKDSNGIWHLPDGKTFTVHVVIPAFHVLASRLGYAAVEQWRRFGIDVVDESIEASLFWSRYQTGDFDIIIAWPFCSAHIDTWQWWQIFHEKYAKPIGEVATSNQIRWVNHKVSELLDEMAVRSPEDPEIKELAAEILKESFKDMPTINFMLGSKMVVVDTYVWTNWPTRENWYWEFIYWNRIWTNPIMTKLQPTGNVPSSEISAPTGPTGGETAELSGINATLAVVIEELSNVKGEMANVAANLESLSGEMSSLNSQIGTLVTLNTLTIILLIIAIVLIFTTRKKE